MCRNARSKHGTYIKFQQKFYRTRIYKDERTFCYEHSPIFRVYLQGNVFYIQRSMFNTWPLSANCRPTCVTLLFYYPDKVLCCRYLGAVSKCETLTHFMAILTEVSQLASADEYRPRECLMGCLHLAGGEQCQSTGKQQTERPWSNDVPFSWLLRIHPISAL